ncbi:MAG: ketose-bisphosphate aldolase [Desulfobacterales bacterium]|nr:ketose-bisphosphate aldolase [Desulfobacterales bacterium]MCP4159975.1 ketose-bisphosphate aldolase [Deltaproteobacteria bacterium]
MPTYSTDFEKALEVGRPPNVKKLFPNSKALIVSGKYIDRAMRAKGKAMTIAANGRSQVVIRGVLKAAQKANAAVIIEIARTEGGIDNYCGTTFWNMARQVDAVCNEMGITIPVAIHADHYVLKAGEDLDATKIEIDSIFDAGVTSIAIDASHQPDDDNLLTNIAINSAIPDWAGLETEIGEIKGNQGLSSSEEALFLIQGLNAHGIFPDWIALNNGSTHGIEEGDEGIQVDLTAEIHNAISKYKVSGAQHGTSGNNSDRLRKIADDTETTKANVATALQMISWGMKVNEYGNSIFDEKGDLIKIEGEGLSEKLWAEMKAYADEQNIKGSNFKKINRPFENRILAQTREVRERMVDATAEFAYDLLANVFNAEGTGDLLIQEILEKNSYDSGPLVGIIESKDEWTEEKIRHKASLIITDKGPDGDFSE